MINMEPANQEALLLRAKAAIEQLQHDLALQEQRAASANDAADAAAKDAAQWRARDEAHVCELAAMEQERNQAREAVASYMERNRVLLQAKQDAEVKATKLQDAMEEARRMHFQAMEDTTARWEATCAQEAAAVTTLTDKLAALAAAQIRADEKRAWMSRQLKQLAVVLEKEHGRRVQVEHALREAVGLCRGVVAPRCPFCV